jgi:hypothetical protein
MVLVRSLLLHLVNKSIRICICSSTLTVLAKAYMVTIVLLFTVVTIIHTFCTMKELCYYSNVWSSLRFVEESEALDSVNLYRRVSFIYIGTETCFCFKFSSYWNATCCSRPLLYGYSLCSIFFTTTDP